MIVRDGNESVIKVVRVKEKRQGERAGDTKEKGSNRSGCLKKKRRMFMFNA